MNQISPPYLSVVIPGFNRVALLEQTLDSVRHAINGMNAEVIIMDDGSSEPIEQQLQGVDDLPIRHIRQENQGSAVAKYNGVLAASGKYVNILDSDDLVHPDKYRRQIEAMEKSGAEVSYTDEATALLGGNVQRLELRRKMLRRLAENPADFYLKLQPMPHSPVYRKDYLDRYLREPYIKPTRALGPAGDVWIYYCLSIFPARVIKVDGFLTIAGESEEERYTNHWEKLGISALKLMEGFVENCPQTPETHMARITVGECAFMSFRKLPHHFNPEFEGRILRVYQCLPKREQSAYGGRLYRALSTMVGAESAAMALRYVNRPSYKSIQTITEAELRSLLA